MDEKLLDGAKNLSQIEQAVLYCALYDLQKNNPHHELTFEEMSPFIDVLLDQPENWGIQACTLFLRTKLEASSSRRVERSLLQLEVKNKQIIIIILQFFIQLCTPGRSLLIVPGCFKRSSF